MTPTEPMRYRVVLPPAAGGSAIAAIHLKAPSAADLKSFLERHAGGDVPLHDKRLRRVLDIDSAVIARLTHDACLVMPHGSELVVRRIVERFREVGVVEDRRADPFPEAAHAVETLMLQAIAKASSPLAIDVLLGQPSAWQRYRHTPHPDLVEKSRVLNRLIDPPTVVAIGPANVGKSSLLNALARRTVAVVSPQAGTTRDHVGATLDLAGLVVHWVDTPGWHAAAGAIERRAFDLALARVSSADLVVLCGDVEHGFADPAHWNADGKPILRCGTKADLGTPPGCDLAVTTLREGGVQPLAARVREALVPQELLSDPGAWLFDPRLDSFRLA